MYAALVAAAAVSLFGLPKLPPKVPSITPAPVVPQFDCSSTKTIQLPPMRAFGLAPVKGVDWTFDELSNERLKADVVALPRGIDVVLRLSARSEAFGGTDYAREQHLRLPVTPPTGCEVSHTSATPETITLRGSESFERVFGNTFVDEAMCMGDTTNPEKMKRTGCRRIEFHPITVHFRQKSPTTCSTIEIVPPPVDAMTIKKTLNGDDAFSTSEAYVEIDVENEVTSTRVELETRVTIAEASDDRSRFTTDWIASTVFDTALQAPGCKITSVELATGRLRDRAKYTNNAGYRPSVLDGSAAGSDRRGVLKFAGCRSATGGPKEIGCMVSFNAIRIHLAPA